MAYVNALVFLLFIAYGNARNLSLVLVNDAVSEVGSCVPGARTGQITLIHFAESRVP